MVGFRRGVDQAPLTANKVSAIRRSEFRTWPEQRVHLAGMDA